MVLQLQYGAQATEIRLEAGCGRSPYSNAARSHYSNAAPGLRHASITLTTSRWRLTRHVEQKGRKLDVGGVLLEEAASEIREIHEPLSHVLPIFFQLAAVETAAHTFVKIPWRQHQSCRCPARASEMS